MKLLLTLLSCASVVASATATITPSMNSSTPMVRTVGGQTAYVFQLTVDLSADDDWTGANITATCIHPALTWYQNAVNDGNPPDPALFGSYPDSRWTSYYTSPADYPTSPYDGSIVGFTSVAEGGWTLSTDWFDRVDGPTGATDALIGQFTLVSSMGPASGYVGSASGTVSSAYGSVPFSYDLYVPEPGTVALLLLGGMVSLARRR